MELKSKLFFFIIIVIGSIIHLLLIYSMFDIFFKFPINFGMTPHSPNLSENELPSNRVVIFMLDGIRADSFYEGIYSKKNGFLRKVIEKRGVYGISHAKVPTETKPCLTAMFSGHFEDASLALLELSAHTVHLDSVFNQSDFSIGIGLDASLFAEVAKSMFCVPFKVEQNYGDKNSEQSNYKLFNTIIDLFNKTKKNRKSDLYKNLNKKKVTFFLHIAQTDTLGHKYGPRSKRIIDHIKDLDSYFEKMEKTFYHFYHDNRTTFIITADHGMDLRTVHGDGNPDCTRTPLLIWGAGIRKAIPKGKKSPKKGTPNKGRLDNFVRHDISQIDLTPLISGLIGSNFPMNSLGIIPLNILDISDKVKAKLIYGNLKEIFEIYKIKNEYANKSIIFKPFKPLDNSDEKINSISDDIDKGNYLDAINKAKILINITLEGINYILHYDRLFLKSVIISGYILWMLYIFIFIEMKNENKLEQFFFYSREENIFVTIISLLIFFALFIYLIIRNSPFLYYLYTIFPWYFFWRIFSNIKYLKKFFIKQKGILPFLKTIISYGLSAIAFYSIVSHKKIIIILIIYIGNYV